MKLNKEQEAQLTNRSDGFAKPVLPAVFYEEGCFVTYPPMILDGGDMICPVCQKRWHRTTGSRGFVKSSVSKHIGSCYTKELEKRGLVMQQPYNGEKLGWLLIKHSR